MFWIPVLLISLIVIVLEIIFTQNWIRAAIVIVISIVITFIIITIDYSSQVTDKEVWSGSVVDWEHKEEWDEWHPPKTTTETYTTTVNGQSVTKTRTKTKPGYWEHHYAKNKIKTSDDGWFTVKESPTGKKFDDSWPNDDKPLKEFWPKGLPTASTHTYVNKVNASYSIYKHEEIDLKDYPDLPSYPDSVRDDFYVDRFIGEVPNKKEANNRLSYHNTRLNKFIPDPENEGEKRSWKQVNIIFVNVGVDKPEDYGFALQDNWEGGNKNDFIVSFSMNNDGTLNWVYPFSWSEVELLKLEVRDYMMNLKTVNDFVPIVDEVAKLVEEKFERKEFADFNYLQIDISTTAIVFIWILNIAALIVNVIVLYNEKNLSDYRRLRKSNMRGRY